MRGAEPQRDFVLQSEDSYISINGLHWAFEVELLCAGN